MSLLKEPLDIKNLHLKNRLIMPPMATSKSNAGSVSDELLAYYDDKTKDQALALVITEHAYVSKEGQAGPNQLSISKDEDIPGLRRLAQTIHHNNTLAIAQISHAGMKAKLSSPGLEIAGPSNTCPDAPGFMNRDIHVLDPDEIQTIIRQFGDAACRVKEAGFDGVEIHAAHGYLLNQFYSPLTNQRNDEYTGKTLEGRTRLIHEIVAEIKSRTGKDYPVFLRLGACDYMKDGTSVQDSVKAALEFEKDGIDVLDVSGGLCFYNNPTSTRPGYFSDASRPIHEALQIPVILTGGIKTACQAKQMLEENNATLIGVGRAVLKDSRWPAKALAELED